jgi:nicotinamide mononucleotide transporter
MADFWSSWLQSLSTMVPGGTSLGETNIDFLVAAWLLAIMVGAVRVNHWIWPLVMCGHLLQAAAFWQSHRYAGALVQSLFVMVAAWGWAQWRWFRPHSGAPKNVEVLSARQRIDVAMVWLVVWPTLAFVWDLVWDSSRPGWDAFITTGHVLGLWLLGRKLTECWPVFIVTHTVIMGLLAYSGSWLVLPLYGLLIACALWGWRIWLRSLRPVQDC